MADLDAAPEGEIPPAARILDITHTAFVTSRSLYVMAKLGIADLLAGGPQTSDQLATATGSRPDAIYRVLRALGSVGVLTESEGRRFALTPVGETLQSDRPDSMRSWVLFTGEPWNLQAWAEIMHSVRTGECAFDKAHGAPMFEYLAKTADASKVFDDAMTSFSQWDAAVVPGAYDFSGFKRLVDIGGGKGALFAAILKANPELHGVLFDQAHVVTDSRTAMEAEGLAGRCEIVSGDFFESVPAGGDAYLLKYIVHDWNDERALAILRNCRKAMKEGSKLLVIEMIVPPVGESHLSKTSDVEMLVMLGSPERTLEEYEALLKQAGFRLDRVVATPEAMSIIEATPV